MGGLIFFSFLFSFPLFCIWTFGHWPVLLNSGVSSLGVPGVPWHTQILADQLTIFQPGGTDYAQLITTGTPRFSDLPTALCRMHFFSFTGCLNMLCPTSNQHFFRLKWHSKHKPSIFGMLSRGDLCLVHRFIYFCFVHSLYSLRSSGCQNSSFLKPCSLKFEVMRLIKSCNGKIYA